MKAQNWNVEYFVEGYSLPTISGKIREIINACGFKVVRKLRQLIGENAFTDVFVLKESHLFIHTWPEAGRTYIQLSSCNEEKYRIFMDFIRKYFQVVVEKDNGLIE